VLQFLLNLELRFPLFGRFRGIGFIDAGNVWQDREYLKLGRFLPRRDPESVSAFDVRWTYGLGLRFATPVGAIRFDYAWLWNLPVGAREETERWYVALGQSF
jgi:outer membrane protein insertion porin family